MRELVHQPELYVSEGARVCVQRGSDAQASRVLNAGLRSRDDLSEGEQGQFSLMMAGTFQGFESVFGALINELVLEFRGTDL